MPKNKKSLIEPINNVDYNKNPQAAYYQNWLNNRRSQLTENMIHTKSGRPINELYHNLTGKHREWINEEYYRQKNNVDSATLYRDYDEYVNASNLNKHKGISDSTSTLFGEFESNSRNMYVNPLDTGSTEIHERTHSALPNPQSAKIKKLLKDRTITISGTGDYTEKSFKYLTDPEEIYSRLMELRYNNDIDPNKNPTLQDIKKYRDINKDNELFNIFTDEDLEILLRDVADNAQNSNDMKIAKARNGGRIRKFNYGGTTSTVPLSAYQIRDDVNYQYPQTQNNNLGTYGMISQGVGALTQGLDKNQYNQQYGYQTSGTAAAASQAGPVGGIIGGALQTVGNIASTANDYNEYGYNENETAGALYNMGAAGFDPSSQLEKDISTNDWGSAAMTLLGGQHISSYLDFNDEQDAAKKREKEAKKLERQQKRMLQEQTPKTSYTPTLQYPRGGRVGKDKDVKRILGYDSKGNPIYSKEPSQEKLSVTYTPNILRPRTLADTRHTAANIYNIPDSTFNNSYKKDPQGYMESLASQYPNKYKANKNSVGEWTLSEYIPDTRNKVTFADGGKILTSLKSKKKDNIRQDTTSKYVRKYPIEEHLMRESRKEAVLSLRDEEGIKDSKTILEYLNYNEKGNKIGDFTINEVDSILTEYPAKTYNSNIKKLADGGKFHTMPDGTEMSGAYHGANAELETDEVYRTPDGDIEEVPEGTPSHSKGGIKMQLPEGTEILGKMKGKYKGKTYKELGQTLKTKYDKYNNIIDSPDSSRLSKSTARKMIEKIQADFDKLWEDQEVQKSIYKYHPEFKSNKDFPGNLETIERPKEPIYRKGGKVENEYGLEESYYYDFLQDQKFPKSKKYSTYENPYYGDVSGSVGTSSNNNSFGNTLGNIAQFAPAAYNLYQGVFGEKRTLDAQDFRNPYTGQIRRDLNDLEYNVRPELEANELAYQTGKRNIRQIAPSVGNLLTNYSALSGTRMRADATSLARKQNMDNQYRAQRANILGQLGSQEASTKFGVSRYNEAVEAARQGAISTGIDQLAGAAVNIGSARNQKENDKLKIQALQSYVTKYNMDPRDAYAFMQLIR